MYRRMHVRVFAFLLSVLIVPLAVTQEPAGADPLVTMSGMVTDQQGSPIDGVTVTAVPVGGGSSVSTTTPSTSGTTGSYAISVPAGTYNVSFTPAAGSGLQTAILNGISLQSNQTYNVTIAPTQAPERTVQVLWHGSDSGEFTLAPIGNGSVLRRSAADGRYFVTPGQYRIGGLESRGAQLDDFEPVVDTTSGNVTMQLSFPRSNATVRLVDQNNAPITSASFSTTEATGTTNVTFDSGAGPATTTTAIRHVARTDSAGNASANLLLATGLQYSRVCASAPGYNNVCQDVSITGGDAVNLTLTTTPLPFSRLGINLDTGGGAQLASGTVTAVSDGATYAQSMADGRFRLPYGQYTATGINNASIRLLDATPTFGATGVQSSLDVTPSRSPVTVTVRDQNGQLVPNATVSTNQASGAVPVTLVGQGLDTTVTMNATSTARTTLTTGSGTLGTFTGMTHTSLCISAPNVQQQQCVNVDIVAGQPEPVVVVVQSTLPPPPTRLIGVYLTDGTTTNRAEASVTATDGTGRTYGSSAVDGFIRVPAGMYQVTRVGSNFSLSGSSPTIDTTQQNADITVRYQPATLDVQILDPSGVPLTGAGWYAGPGSGQTEITWHPGTPQALTQIVNATSQGQLITGLTYTSICAFADTMPLTCQNISFVAGDPNVHVVFQQPAPSDTTPPLVTNMNVTPATIELGDSAELTADVDDSESPIARVEYFIDNDPGAGNATEVSLNDGRVSVALSGLAPGVWNIGVRALDTAGNWSAVSSATLTVTLPAPTNLHGSSPTNNPTLTWSASVEATTYQVYRDGNMVATTSATTHQDQQAPEGQHTYVVRAVHANGAESAPSNEVTLLIDRTAPVVTVNGPGNNATYALGSAPSASCTTTDALSGVATNATLSSSRNASGVYTATCSGGLDMAGNAGSATVTYTVSPTTATLATLTNQYLATSSSPRDIGASIVLNTLLTTNQICLYITSVGQQSQGIWPPLSTTQAAELIYWARVLRPTC
jgi:hypothetical protein